MSSEDSNDGDDAGRNVDQGRSDDRDAATTSDGDDETDGSQPRDPETGQFLPADERGDDAGESADEAAEDERGQPPAAEGEEGGDDRSHGHEDQPPETAAETTAGEGERPPEALDREASRRRVTVVRWPASRHHSRPSPQRVDPTRSGWVAFPGGGLGPGRSPVTDPASHSGGQHSPGMPLGQSPQQGQSAPDPPAQEAMAQSSPPRQQRTAVTGQSEPETRQRRATAQQSGPVTQGQPTWRSAVTQAPRGQTGTQGQVPRHSTRGQPQRTQARQTAAQGQPPQFRPEDVQQQRQAGQSRQSVAVTPLQQPIHSGPQRPTPLQAEYQAGGRVHQYQHHGQTRTGASNR